MKLATFLGLALLAALTTAAPTSDDDVITVTSEFFPDELAVYTSQHQIVALTVPLNSVNFDEDENPSDDDPDIIVFFVEADVNDKGEKEYKGLYALKGGKAEKVLETGTDAAADNTDSDKVFLSATDGLYVYSGKTKKAEKYGSISDNLISVVKLNSTDELLVLTADHEVYKVTDNGEKKVKIDEIKDAQQIVLDFSDNVYFYGPDKQPYVLADDGVKKIEGLPANPSSVALIKPAFVIEDGVVFMSDDKAYIIYANGTSEFGEFVFQVKPSAYAMEATLIQYYAYNGKIYEYNILAIIIGSALEELKKFLEDKAEDIQSIATRSRGVLKASSLMTL